jgi:hypothetical protein
MMRLAGPIGPRPSLYRLGAHPNSHPRHCQTEATCRPGAIRFSLSGDRIRRDKVRQDDTGSDVRLLCLDTGSCAAEFKAGGRHTMARGHLERRNTK